MKVNQAQLKIVAATVGQIPKETLPEIVFAGKSNVGKSSLINTLVNRKSLARTSSQPGKTRTINFYELDEKLYFVDLPGYGYAKVGAAEQERFSKVIDHYLMHRSSIVYLFVLVDIRHEPGANDIQMVEWMRHYGYEPVIIATKSDKLSKNQVNHALAVIRKTLKLSRNQLVLPFSALNKEGTEAIWEVIEKGLSEPDEEQTREMV